jgi:hypothetical protein
MKIYTTAPLEDPRKARTLFPSLEDIGYDGAFGFEAKHDPSRWSASETRSRRSSQSGSPAWAPLDTSQPVG